MGKLILPALVAFLLALGGTSGMAVVKAKAAARVAAAAPHDSTSADSTHAGADSAHAPATALDSVVAAAMAAARAGDSTAADSAHAAAGADLRAPPVRRANATGVAAVPSPIDTAKHDVRPDVKKEVVPAAQPATAPLQERRLAKIFGTMAPKDAAKVLLQMGDDDVHTILGYLGDRQAAAILVNFPPQRAALIGRSAMLHPAGAPIAARGTGLGEGQ